MTLSNFDWTDKTSVRWFILLPTGHEGPYDLISVRQRCQQGQIGRDVQVWAEGLKQPVTLNHALLQSESTTAYTPSAESIPKSNSRAERQTVPDPVRLSRAHELAEKMSEEAEIPPLPGEQIPPVPRFQATVEPYAQVTAPITEKTGQQKKPFPFILSGLLFFSLLFSFFIYQWIKGEENFEIRRYPKMSMEVHQRILKEFSFKGWNERIFFREYVPVDLSYIWLVTSSFQKCEVEASFQSIPGKMISVKDEPVAFKTRGILDDHVVEFSSFDFRSGNKIVPGMYELDVKAGNCEWDTTASGIANIFRPVEKEYMARMKVVLFPKGPIEYNSVLSVLLKKKEEKVLREQGREQLFWQDLQQKFQTLLAISLQIEQHLIDLLETDPKLFRQNLVPAIDIYTKKFGNFLTNFVVSNESYFDQLGDLKERSKKRNYEVMVNSTSKRIGHESMKLIEDLQKIKKPTKAQLNTFQVRLKKTYAGLKEEINQKIILISEDHPY